MLASNAPVLAVVGATGLVGQTFFELIEERDFPFSDILPVASERSAGRIIKTPAGPRTVEALSQFDFRQAGIAFFSAGTARSELHGRRAASDGALVIDNTNAFRMDADVPLVVPQVNAHTIDQRPASGIIANPNCSTIPLVRALRPLDDDYGIESVIVSTYQAASGAGESGREEVLTSVRACLAGETDTAVKFADPLGFNLVPNIDAPLSTGFTVEERKLLTESRKILERPDLHVSATCVRVPVVNCHSETAYVRCRRPVDRDRLVARLTAAPDVVVHDRGAGEIAYPTPRFIVDHDKVHVGRIRVDPENQNSFWVWIVSDNVRVGAALNAIQVAEHVLGRGWLQ